MPRLRSLYRLSALALTALLAACASAPELAKTPATAPAPAAKPADPEQERVCSEYRCRGATTVSLRLPGGEQLSRSFDWFSPVLQDGTVTALPGETLYIEAEAMAERLTKLRQVDKLANPERTLILKFQQVKDGLDMVLSVHNPFPRSLKYRLVADDGAGKLSNVSTCPVRAGGSGYETWEQPIFQLVLMDLKLEPMGTKPVCE